MKKLSWAVLVISIFMLSMFKLYFMVMPEIVVTNKSGLHVKVVTIQLPSNKIEFDTILPGESYTIYYNLEQADGTYKYSIQFETGETLKGECGYLTHNEIGKAFQLIIHNINKVSCSG